MIDIKFLREHPDEVRENIRKKFQDHKLPLVDEVIELDVKSRGGAAGGRQPSGAEKQAFQGNWKADGAGKEGRGGGSKGTGERQCGPSSGTGRNGKRTAGKSDEDYDDNTEHH